MPKRKSVKKSNNETVISGYVLITLGLIFILNVLIGWGVMWPLFISLGGIIGLINYSLTGREKEEVFISVGVLFALTVFFLLFTTGLINWSQMSWLWPGFLLAPAFGLIGSYFATGDKSKLTPAGVLLTLFIVFVSAFKMGLWNYWPIIFIVAGIIIVVLSRSKKD